MIKTGALRTQLFQRERQNFSALACFSEDAVRQRPEDREATEYRLAFSADADRILNSLAFTRYSDKTQVFSLIRNDHLTHRILHVQMLSRVARTIGRYLGLNPDLIEAASLGHDIGHPPFGHDGEAFLSELTQAAGAGTFFHNRQSIQFLDRIERNGSGWNLSLQTLDAILCHNGEAHSRKLRPAFRKDFNEFNLLLSQMRQDPALDPMPMTMEGCVVRMADTISYIGRDLEDAIRLGIVARKEIPFSCAKILGTTQGTIVFTLVTDLIQTSMDQDYIAFSPEISEGLQALKTFNYERIYKNPAIKKHLAGIEDSFRHLFARFIADLEKENRTSVIFTEFLDGMDESYARDHKPGEIVRDFIAGMTDSYFIRQAPMHLRPGAVDHV
jgi:dGTPase